MSLVGRSDRGLLHTDIARDRGSEFHKACAARSQVGGLDDIVRTFGLQKGSRSYL